MKYQRPSKMGHNKGRNPEYALVNTTIHKPLLRAIKVYKDGYSGGERVALGTVLSELALDGSPELEHLYEQELNREDGDEV